MEYHMNLAPTAQDPAVSLASFTGLLSLLTERVDDRGLLQESSFNLDQFISTSMNSVLQNTASIHKTEIFICLLGDVQFIRYRYNNINFLLIIRCV